MAGLTDQNEKVAVAMDVFGKSGVDLLPMLASGKEGLDAMKQKAHDLGLVMDQEAAEKAAKLTDAMSTMKGSMTGVMMTIAEQLAPFVTKLAEGIEKLISKVTKWTEENPKLTAVIVPIVGAIGALLAVAGPLMLAFGAITSIAPAVAGAFAIMTGPIGIIVLAIAALALAWSTNFLGIRDKTQAVFNFIRDLFDSKFGWLLPGGALIKGLIFIRDNWHQIWDSIVKGFQSQVNSIIGFVNKMIKAINVISFGQANIPLIPLIGGSGSSSVSQGMGGPTDMNQRRFAGRTDWSAFEGIPPEQLQGVYGEQVRPKQDTTSDFMEGAGGAVTAVVSIDGQLLSDQVDIGQGLRTAIEDELAG